MEVVVGPVPVEKGVEWVPALDQLGRAGCHSPSTEEHESGLCMQQVEQDTSVLSLSIADMLFSS